MGCEYVTCPACNKETMVNDKRIVPPTWKATFDHNYVGNGAVEVYDHEIGEYINKAVKVLCSDKYKPGEFYMVETGNVLIVGLKWEDNVDIYVTRDCWEDSIDVNDYDMVK